MDTIIAAEPVAQINKQFFADVINGLNSIPKKLNSKYFYDKQGDKLFQEIMASPEYYLTNCEMEILTQQSADIAASLTQQNTPFDLIELGAGDATKSIHLLQQLIREGVSFNYLPLDISANVIRHLEDHLPNELPKLQIHGFTGDYFDMLDQAVQFSSNRKVVLFMGANIGNMLPIEAKAFCIKLKNSLLRGDMLIIGFDLKKNPKEILAAYNDSEGITKRFNLNLLRRINTELNADFILDDFDHYANYDPRSGACKSYLISLKDQTVKIGSNILHFKKNEYIDMEISQKYSKQEIGELMTDAGFEYVTNFYDTNHYFVDSVWSVK
ncbi:L-histidine N-alpha-methyltransferase [Pedobacter sp. UYP30]|uniref:L-histidine N(alpha)-methyltransferase n=1 Tax=Pedobacter sp. UYP30 TaxID=1756400 RepID=UPI00339B7CEA